MATTEYILTDAAPFPRSTATSYRWSAAALPTTGARCRRIFMRAISSCATRNRRKICSASTPSAALR